MPKILIVDDELVSDALEDEGFSTVLAHDGKTALALIQQAQDFSLIILDIMMPEMDGLELCRKVRDLVSCPILFVTAKSRTLDTLVGLEMGADDYIYKPFVAPRGPHPCKAGLPLAGGRLYPAQPRKL